MHVYHVPELCLLCFNGTMILPMIRYFTFSSSEKLPVVGALLRMLPDTMANMVC